MGLLGHIWGTAQELLHPRGKNGQFVDKPGVGMDPSTAKRIEAKLASINFREFQSDGQASQHLFNAYKDWPEGDKRRLLADLGQTNVHLRAGQMDESTKKFVDMMDRQLQPSHDDLILHRTMTPEAFGITPEMIDAEDGGIWDMPGKVIADKGYSAFRIGTPQTGGGAGQIHMVVVAPKGTKIAPTRNGPNDRGVMGDRDMPIRITRVSRDGQGGYHVLAIVDPEAGGGTPHALGGPEKAVGTPATREARVNAPTTPPGPRALARQDVAEQQRLAQQTPAAGAAREQASIAAHEQRMGRLGPAPVGPTDTGPGGPPPRNEPIHAESIGGAPTPQAGAPQAPTPAAPTEPVRQVDFREAFKEAGIGSPSEGKRRAEFNKAYLGVTSGKKNPDDALRELEADINVNKRALVHAQADGISDKDREFANDIKIQEQLADLIATHHGLERHKKAPEVVKAPTSPSVLQSDIVGRAQRSRPGEPSAKPLLHKAAELQRAKEIQTGQRHMTIMQARHTTAVEALDKHKVTGHGSEKYQEIAKGVESGNWSVPRAVHEAGQEHKRWRSEGVAARQKADNASGPRAVQFRHEASEHDAMAEKYLTLQKGLRDSQTPAATDKFINPPKQEHLPVPAAKKRALPKEQGVAVPAKKAAPTIAVRGGGAVNTQTGEFIPAKKTAAPRAPKAVKEPSATVKKAQLADQAKLLRERAVAGGNIDAMTKDELLADPRAAGVPKSWTKDKIKAHVRGETPAPVKRAPAAPKISRAPLTPEQRANHITSNPDLTPGQKRSRLRSMGMTPEQVDSLAPLQPRKTAVKKAVPSKAEPVIQNPVAQREIHAPDRKASFDQAWDAKGFEAPQGSANRSLQEVRDDISTGKITPDEGVRRLESEIQLNSEEMVSMDKALRGDLTPEETAKLKAQRLELGKSIRAQIDASKFVREHFKKEPDVTPGEIKIASPEAGALVERMKNMTPSEMADFKRQLKDGGFGDVQGNTGEELFNNALKEVAKKEMARREAVKAAKLAAAPKAPEKRLPNIEGSKYQRLDSRALAEGLDLRSENDVKMLDTIQQMLDNNPDAPGPRNPTPAQVGRYLETWRTGPGGPGTSAGYMLGVGRQKHIGETDAEYNHRIAELEKEAAPKLKSNEEWKKLADRLMNTRRQPAQTHTPETKPAVTSAERKDIAKTAELTGIPSAQLEAKALQQKKAAAPAKQSAQQVSETLRTVGSRDEARALLQGRTKADLLEILKAEGVPGPRGGSKATKADIANDIVELHGARLDGNALRNLGPGGQPEPGAPTPRAGGLSLVPPLPTKKAAPAKVTPAPTPTPTPARRLQLLQGGGVGGAGTGPGPQRAGTPDLAGARGLSSNPAVRQVQVENRLRDGIKKLQGQTEGLSEQTNWHPAGMGGRTWQRILRDSGKVMIADLRASVPELTREEFDQAMIGLIRQQDRDMNVFPLEAQMGLRPIDRTDSIHFPAGQFGHDYHYIDVVHPRALDHRPLPDVPNG